MQPKHIATCLIAAILAGTTGEAKAIEVRGSRSCGAWIQEGKTKTRVFTETWLLGYLSGVAMGLGVNFLPGTDNESIFLWMDNYCQKEPLNQIAEGAGALFYELRKKRGV